MNSKTNAEIALDIVSKWVNGYAVNNTPALIADIAAALDAREAETRAACDAEHAKAIEEVRDRCHSVALEERCERGTPWDAACVAIANKIMNTKLERVGPAPASRVPEDVIEALKFYADPKSWHIPYTEIISFYSKRSAVSHDDLSGDLSIGGHRARECLRKLGVV